MTEKSLSDHGSFGLFRCDCGQRFEAERGRNAKEIDHEGAKSGFGRGFTTVPLCPACGLYRWRTPVTGAEIRQAAKRLRQVRDIQDLKNAAAKVMAMAAGSLKAREIAPGWFVAESSTSIFARKSMEVREIMLGGKPVELAPTEHFAYEVAFPTVKSHFDAVMKKSIEAVLVKPLPEDDDVRDYWRHPTHLRKLSRYEAWLKRQEVRNELKRKALWACGLIVAVCLALLMWRFLCR